MSLTNSPDPSIRDAVVGQDLNSVLHFKPSTQWPGCGA